MKLQIKVINYQTYIYKTTIPNFTLHGPLIYLKESGHRKVVEKGKGMCVEEMGLFPSPSLQGQFGRKVQRDHRESEMHFQHLSTVEKRCV